MTREQLIFEIESYITEYLITFGRLPKTVMISRRFGKMVMKRFGQTLSSFLRDEPRFTLTLRDDGSLFISVRNPVVEEFLHAAAQPDFSVARFKPTAVLTPPVAESRSEDRKE